MEGSLKQIFELRGSRSTNLVSRKKSYPRPFRTPTAKTYVSSPTPAPTQPRLVRPKTCDTGPILPDTTVNFRNADWFSRSATTNEILRRKIIRLRRTSLPCLFQRRRVSGKPFEVKMDDIAVPQLSSSIKNDDVSTLFPIEEIPDSNVEAFSKILPKESKPILSPPTQNKGWDARSSGMQGTSLHAFYSVWEKCRGQEQRRTVRSGPPSLRRFYDQKERARTSSVYRNCSCAPR